MKYPIQGHQRDHHLPISPSPAHPDNGILLFLQNSAELRKKSYIKTERKYTINVASLDPYCSSGKEYKLKESSNSILKAYINFIPPTTHPNLHSEQFEQPFAQPSTSSPDVLTAPHLPSWTTQQAPLQIPSRSYITATSRSIGTGPSQAPVFLPSYRTHAISNTWQDPYMYDDPQRTKRASLLPDTQPSSPSSPSTPEPESSAIVVFIAPLMFLGFVGSLTYGRYRLLNLGKWALKEIKGKWNDPLVTLEREKGLQFIRAIWRDLVSMVCSVDGGTLFDSIKNRIGGISQGLEAHIRPSLGYCGPILSRLMEKTLNLLNPS